MTVRDVVARVLYGAVFVVGVPVLLVWWAASTADVVPLPTMRSRWVGVATGLLGFTLLASAMAALMIWGRGLPMNAFPPPAYVNRGPYRLMRDPMYVGFFLMCLGVSVWVGSASGLWLVSPIVALVLAALVLGYERDDLRKRFGEAVLEHPRLCLPNDTDQRPTTWNRISIYLLVFLPWTLAFEAVYRLGIPIDAVEAYLPFERNLPVLQWTEPVYASVYLFVGLVPLAVQQQRTLRLFATRGLIATAVVTLIYLTIPVVAPPREFVPDSVFGRMLTWERAMSHTVAAFPAFHVVWTLIAADAWVRHFRRAAMLVWTWAALIAVSCISTGMHAIADIVFAGLVYVPIRSYDKVWNAIRRAAERVANSWREWHLGPVRIINHGVYAGLAGATGFLIVVTLVGARNTWGTALVAMCCLIGAGLWAQKLEGSSGLSRPFGFYGGVLGGLIGCLVAGFLGADLLLLYAALAVAAPWVQAIGRLRCLVQGCCHGRRAPEHIGIRYHAPRSRVVYNANMRDVPLHPTPVYSMLSNAVIGVLLFRLWTLGASLALITGLYLMLNGAARFVEESLRGEPQTPLVGRLRIYQWMAVGSLAIGVLFTVAPTTRVAMAIEGPSLTGVLLAVAFGLAAGAAMGVDFPGSNRRFARLASV